MYMKCVMRWESGIKTVGQQYTEILRRHTGLFPGCVEMLTQGVPGLEMNRCYMWPSPVD